MALRVMDAIFGRRPIPHLRQGDERVERFKNFLLRMARMLTVLGVSNPDEVKRKRALYEAQRAARKAREAAAQGADPPSAVTSQQEKK